MPNRPGQVGYDDGKDEPEVVTEYSNPRINTGYDPDHIKTLLSEDEIDWDVYDWDAHPWVQGIGVDTGDYPEWDDMSKRDKKNWHEEMRDNDKSYTFGRGGYEDYLDELGTTANGIVDFEYYKKDPLYLMAYDALGYSEEDRNDLDKLKEATMFITDTYKAVANGDYRIEDSDWDVDPPDPWKPERMDTSDVYTKPDKPQIIQPLPSPNMPASIQAVRARSGSDMIGEYNRREAQLTNTKEN